MKLFKYGGISIAYVCLIQLIHGVLQGTQGGPIGGSVNFLLSALTVVAFVLPIIFIAVSALKINNLYNVRRFALRGLKKNWIAIIIYIIVLFLIGSNCYVGPNEVNIFLLQVDTTNVTALAFCYNIFEDSMSYIFAFLLGIVGLAASYNLPLTGNER